ncbi:MAG: M15 family metallopeptidase [Minisyncoccota bacterium]
MTDKTHTNDGVHHFFARVRRVRAGSWVTAALFLLFGGSFATAAWYGYTRIEDLSAKIALLQASLTSTTATLSTSLADATTTISNALSAQSRNVANVQEQLGGVQSQVGSIGGTVDTLQKLSKLDPQLLEKYSRVYFLSENYVPASLVDIPNQYKYFDSRQEQFLTQAYPYLANMLTQAQNDGVALYVYSAYRSFGTQAALKSEYMVVYGAGTSNQFSADQGYSEHQLGTAVDLITTGQSGQLIQNFDQTSAYTWLVDNAYKYGFILSYPKGNSYYIYEPWHWRFVGVKLATDLHTTGEHFYDLDQRTIDTYLISIFD